MLSKAPLTIAGSVNVTVVDAGVMSKQEQALASCEEKLEEIAGDVVAALSLAATCRI